MGKRIAKIMIDEATLGAAVAQVAAAINRDYHGRSVLLVGVLKGAFVFLSDLVRRLDIDVEIDFMAVASYTGETSTGVVRILKDLDRDITGKHVLIVEDIVDTGLTLNHLTALLKTRGPASVKVCAAFDKPERRQVHCQVDYVGLSIPDAFIVGYGLDYEGRFRQLPYVALLTDDEAEGQG